MGGHTSHTRETSIKHTGNGRCWQRGRETGAPWTHCWARGAGSQAGGSSEMSMETSQLQWVLRGRGKNEATTHAPIRKPHKMRFTTSQTLLITYPFYRPRVSPKSQARWGVRDTDTSKTQDLVSKCSQLSTR